LIALFSAPRAHRDAPCKKCCQAPEFRRESRGFLPPVGGKNPLLNATFNLSLKPFVDRIPVAKFPWQAPPLAPIFGHKKDRGNKGVVFGFHVPALTRKVLRNALKFLLCYSHTSYYIANLP
jgi:hypothetical protein